MNTTTMKSNSNPAAVSTGLRFKTHVKAGSELLAHELVHVAQQNHNQTLVRGLKVKTDVKAGFNPQPDPPG
jgi:Domain of unknown function (DUF4157)